MMKDGAIRFVNLSQLVLEKDLNAVLDEIIKQVEAADARIVVVDSFRTVVRNGHDFPIRIAIEDQLPVSENEDIGVEMLSSTTPPTTTNLRERRGVLEWAFDAKPGEIKEIKFAWRVRWPKDKGMVIVPAG